MKNLRYIILPLLILASLLLGQDKRWLLIYEGAVDKIFIDTSNLDIFKGDDFYVWVLHEVDPPYIIESVPGKIYKSKTYYLFNKRLRKYGMLSIIYYDKEGNVLKSFNYKSDSKVDDYKYNFPILPGSDEEKIFTAYLTLQKTK